MSETVLNPEEKYIPAVAAFIKPEVGMVFPSLDHAFEFYQHYAKEGGFSARKSGQYDSKGIVKLKYFVCYKEGLKAKKVANPSESGDKEKKTRKRPSIRTRCKAFIRLDSDDGKSFKICKFVEGHNHPLVSHDDMHLLAANI